MPEPILPFSSTPPVMKPCGYCGGEMQLVSAVPGVKRIIYSYRCDEGHEDEIITADK